MKPKLCLVVGHSRTYPGVTAEGISEFGYNTEVAEEIEAKLRSHGIVDVVRVWRPDEGNNGYLALAGLINAENPDFIIEMHCNGFEDPQANGSECLFWHSSEKGQTLASYLRHEFVVTLGTTDRGNKAVPTQLTNGSHTLRETRAPCVLAEPGFLTNPEDHEELLNRKEPLAQAYVNGIYAYANKFLGAVATEPGETVTYPFPGELFSINSFIYRVTEWDGNTGRFIKA